MKTNKANMETQPRLYISIYTSFQYVYYICPIYVSQLILLFPIEIPCYFFMFTQFRPQIGRC